MPTFKDRSTDSAELDSGKHCLYLAVPLNGAGLRGRGLSVKGSLTEARLVSPQRWVTA